MVILIESWSYCNSLLTKTQITCKLNAMAIGGFRHLQALRSVLLSNKKA